MQPVNQFYEGRLTRPQIERGVHREAVGGFWEELGTLQFRFLLERGLQPHHRLVDVGCGALRGGVHFVRYLDAGNYYGADVNADLLAAGQYELEQNGLGDRGAHLLDTDSFELRRFDVRFDYALAVSVFTHLPLREIERCLRAVGDVLKPGGAFFASFFEAPHAAHARDIVHERGSVTTHADADPFHQSFEELSGAARSAGLQAEQIGEWGHPRGQRIAAFTLP